MNVLNGTVKSFCNRGPQDLFLPQYKGGKRHATVQVCVAGSNLPVRGRKVGEKKKKELKETNSSLTHHM